VLCLTSCELAPTERSKLVARVNGLFGGIFAPESFTLSQAYYYGTRTGGNPSHRCQYFSGDFIDERPDLDDGAIYKKSKARIDRLQLTDVAGVRPDEPITTLADNRLRLPPDVRHMIINGSPPNDMQHLKGGRGHCRVVGSLVALGLNNAQIKAVYRLGRIAHGPTQSPRGFDGYIERTIKFCRANQQKAVSLDDFRAYMPMHNYIFVPTREMWPASSVNARIRPVGLVKADGTPDMDATGKQKTLPANLWLDRHQAVEQMTWAPGMPMLIVDRLIAEGGWIDHNDVTTFNLYRPPTIEHGDAADVKLWLDHIARIYGDDHEHIIGWLAHRVQRPQDKINHALLLGGAQGIGKDTLLEPVKYAVGPWNFQEVNPKQVMGRFNGFLKSVILRVNEARDLGEFNRFELYETMKPYTASPPNALRVDEKHLREHMVLNCCGVIITTNHKTDGIYLPADDRRTYVAWSSLAKKDFEQKYWNELWGWYADGGFRNVAAYLAAYNLENFDAKAPPLKTAAFWAIVDASRAPEDAELADVLDGLNNPKAITLEIIRDSVAPNERFKAWLADRNNRRAIPHRLEQCGYVPVRNDAANDGLWKINGARQVIYARAELTVRDQLAAAQALKAANDGAL